MKIEIILQSAQDDVYVTVDGQVGLKLEIDDRLTVEKSECCRSTGCARGQELFRCAPRKAEMGLSRLVIIPAREENQDVKTKAPRQTVCNIPTDNPKDPYCGGKLKTDYGTGSRGQKTAGHGKRCVSVPKVQDALR